MANPKGNPQNLKSYKPKWKSGKTKTIRVPIAIANQVLEIARQIDEENVQLGDKTKEKDLLVNLSPSNRTAIIKILTKIFSFPSNKGGAIKELVADLALLMGIKAEKVNRKWIIK